MWQGRDTSMEANFFSISDINSLLSLTAVNIFIEDVVSILKRHILQTEIIV
jgi:hypothetical protein